MGMIVTLTVMKMMTSSLLIQMSQVINNVIVLIKWHNKHYLDDDPEEDNFEMAKGR